MKNRIPVSSVSFTVEDSVGKTTVSETATSYFLSTPSKESPISKQNRVKTPIKWINKVGKKADDFKQHVKLGSKVSATVKGKLRLGARIFQEGGLEKLFKQIFNVRAGEKLLNAFQCYLSTTVGPVAGLLFISTERLAFCSERSLTFTLPTGEQIRTPYKVMIPLKKIKVANQSENVNKPSQKYIQVVTVDKFEFWFMGFLKYQKAFKRESWNQRLISTVLSREEVQAVIAFRSNKYPFSKNVYSLQKNGASWLQKRSAMFRGDLG
ncbi:hypothetical protein NE237_007058 [Protea cynaroides]|uniref:GRAM domain-containing protein n=1 Tax=Protea cynaroides TaxID=273540 RepID=A0A9Q0KPD1_9MAGN|nr:hypothetical protein NE237_007058 [Protea cynaroides]